MKCSNCGTVYNTTLHSECPKCKTKEKAPTPKVTMPKPVAPQSQASKTPVTTSKTVKATLPTKSDQEVKKEIVTMKVKAKIAASESEYNYLTHNAVVLAKIVQVGLIIMGVCLVGGFIGMIVALFYSIGLGLIILGSLCLCGFMMFVMWLFASFLEDYCRHVKSTISKPKNIE